jgi:hypothetical protein
MRLSQKQHPRPSVTSAVQFIWLKGNVCYKMSFVTELFGTELFGTEHFRAAAVHS